MSHISQREARRLRARVVELEGVIDQQRRRWRGDFPGGTYIGTCNRDRDWISGRIEAARMLGHAVVVTTSDDGSIRFFALPLAKGQS